MNYLSFLNSLKNPKTSTFLESVVIPAYKTLCEDENTLPDTVPETDVLIEKKVKDVAALGKLKVTQQELEKNEEELKSKAPGIVEQPSNSQY
jgi:hypothetical protein